MHGIVGEVRVGDVTLHAVHRQATGERAATAHLDGVAQHVGAGRLADDAPVDLLVACFEHLHHLARAVDRWAFLVAGEQESERARVVRMLRDESLGGRHHRGEAALHVGGTARIQHAIDDDGFEGVGAPVFARTGRHDVRVTGKAQHRAAVAAS